MVVGPQGPSRVGQRQIIKPRARRHHAERALVYLGRQRFTALAAHSNSAATQQRSGHPELLSSVRGPRLTDLTDRQRELIVGSLLGDGAMRCKCNALLEVNHGFGQRDYVDWKFRELENLVATPPKARLGNGSRVAYRFTTLTLPALTPYFRAFYPAGRKVVTRVRLTPLTTAVWFMDDGSRSRRSVYLNTQQFDEASQRALAQALAATVIS